MVLGCGGDPESQAPSPSQPAADMPAPGSPAEPSPTPGSDAADAPDEAASESPASEPEPKYTAADFGAPSEKPEPKPTPEETKPAPTPTPDPSSLALAGNLPKNIEELIKGKPRTRPNDVSKWEMSDVVPAVQEKDLQRLKAALPYIVAKNKETPKVPMPLIVIGLRKLLDPQFLADLSNQPQGDGTGTTQPGGMPGGPGPGGMPGEGYGGMGPAMGGQTLTIDQQMAEMIVYALAITDTSEAANILRTIIKDKQFKTVHPQEVTKAAIKGLAFMDADRSQNDEVLFTALTDPKKYRIPSPTTVGGGYPGGPGMGPGAGYGGAQQEQRLTAEQLTKEAEQALKPIASAGLRELLAEYLIKSTTPLSETDRFAPWFTDSVPMNVPGQLTIYKKKVYENIPPSLESFLAKLEQNFTAYSSVSIARLLGVLSESDLPDDISQLAQSNQMGGMGGTQQQSAGWGTGGAGYGGMGAGAPGGYSGGGYGNAQDILAKFFEEKAANISTEKELARLTKEIWNADAANAITARLTKQPAVAGYGSTMGAPMGGGSTTGSNQEVMLACTMPLNKVRNAILKRCKSHYQNGPTTALGNTLGQSNSQTGMDPVAAALAAGGGGNMGGMPGMMGGGGTNSDLSTIDPGLLVVLKMLPREDPNAQPNGNRGGGAPGMGANGNMQHQWFSTSQQLVTKLFSQCYAASQKGSIDTMPIPTGEDAEDPCPLAPHRGAEIATRIDFKLPGSMKGDLGSLQTDPLEVHYIRIEELGNLQKILNHYKRLIKGQNHLLGNNMGYWFDSITEGSTPGSKRSVDVVISPGIPKPVDPFSNDHGGSRRPPKGVPIVVQILTIETADPSK